MDKFEIGRYLGRIEVLLDDISNKENELKMLENTLRYSDDIIELAKTYGRIEQKMIELNKKDELEKLKLVFDELQQEYINAIKNKDIRDIIHRGIPFKALNENNIITIQDFLDRPYEELINIKGISELSIRFIEKALKNRGLYLK